MSQGIQADTQVLDKLRDGLKLSLTHMDLSLSKSRTMACGIQVKFYHRRRSSEAYRHVSKGVGGNNKHLCLLLK